MTHQSSSSAGARQLIRQYGDISVGGSGLTVVGDVHNHGTYLDHGQKQDGVRKLGLCLGSAPQIDSKWFVGRVTEIDEMNRALLYRTPPAKQQRLVLGGMGGVGKTQLALAYAERYCHKYDSVFWVDATSEVTLQTGFRLIAGQLIKAEHLSGFNDEQIVPYVHEWLSKTDNTSWLLIFDNYDYPDEFDISKFCPYTAHGSIIITTRLPDLVRVGNFQMRIQPFKETEQGVEVLRIRSGRENIKNDLSAHRLAERLEGLPLALATAGAYLCRSASMSCQQYLETYDRQWHVGGRRPLRLQEYHRDETLYTTWNITYTRLQSEDPLVTQLLKLLAYFDSQEIWHELLQAGGTTNAPIWLRELSGDIVIFESAMMTLVDYCLVDVQPATQSYTIHRCVHDWTLAELNKEIDNSLYYYAISCVAASIRDKDEEDPGQLYHARLVSHAVRHTHSCFPLDNFSGQADTDCLDQIFRLGAFLHDQSRFAAAEKMYKRALAGYTKVEGSGHWSILVIMNNLGLLFRTQGRTEEARQMLEEALARHEKVLGPEDDLTLTIMANLGRCYQAEGRSTDAEHMYKEVLAIYKRLRGDDSTSFPGTSSNPDAPQQLQDEEREKYGMRILRISVDLGITFMDQGRLKDAEYIIEQGLSKYQKEQEIDHRTTFTMFKQLARLYQDQGKLEQAEKTYRKALEGLEALLGPNHQETLYAVSSLGALYSTRHKLVEAELMLRRALEGFEKHFASNNPWLLTVVNSLGSVYEEQGRLEEADAMYNRVLAVGEEFLGADSASTLGAIHNLGFIHFQRNNYVEAERLYTRAINGYRKVTGPDNVKSLHSEICLAVLYCEQDRLDEADLIYKQLLARWKDSLGNDHPKILQVYLSFGWLCTKQGKKEVAWQMYERALAGYQKMYDPEHPIVQQLIRRLDELYHTTSTDLPSAQNTAKVNTLSLWKRFRLLIRLRGL